MTTQTIKYPLLKDAIMAACFIIGGYVAVNTSLHSIQTQLSNNTQDIQELKESQSEIKKLNDSVIELKSDVKHINRSVQRIERKIEEQ